MSVRQQLFTAAERLHGYLLRRHYRNGTLLGPDAGVRFNLRAWRFLKSALDFLPFRDEYVFIQTQGYWILANWMLHEATGDPRWRDVALESAEATLGLQRADGAWTYPLPERRHLVATVEGNWGAIGLLASYARRPEPRFLAGAVRWYDYLVERIGFEQHQTGKAINYFDKPRGKVPNNSVEAAWVFARLWRATGDERYLEHLGGMVEFVKSVQLATGELPYVVESPYERGRKHYLCYQYNAFQFLKLAWLGRLRPSESVSATLSSLAKFLATGMTARGASAEDCSSRWVEVDYYTAALAAALDEAARIGLVDNTLSQRAYDRVMRRQKRDGSFAYSTGDYGILSDSRSYPRPMAMTLFHLLYGAGAGDGFPKLQRQD